MALKPPASITPLSSEQSPTLGANSDGDLKIDVEKLLVSGMLITAASGGGKSWAIRRLLEQTAHIVQQLVIDPEGEFHTLAEKYSLLICKCGADADISLSVEKAADLARELMNCRVSAVLDISEMDIEERHLFVAAFIDGLMSIPKEIWSKALVIIDEAHLFAPQQDKSEAKKAIINMSGRGRKRGFRMVLATQRLSKLNKSVVAELQNRMIGLTTLDVDLRRASDELGMPVRQASNILCKLEVGEFLVFGPALSSDIKTVKIGEVFTRHGHIAAAITPPLQITASVLSSLAAAVHRESAEIADTFFTEDQLQFLRDHKVQSWKLPLIKRFLGWSDISFVADNFGYSELAFLEILVNVASHMEPDDKFCSDPDFDPSEWLRKGELRRLGPKDRLTACL